MKKEKLFFIPDKYLQINTKIQISLCDDDARLDPYMHDDGRYYSKRRLINFS